MQEKALIDELKHTIECKFSIMTLILALSPFCNSINNLTNLSQKKWTSFSWLMKFLMFLVPKSGKERQMIENFKDIRLFSDLTHAQHSFSVSFISLHTFYIPHFASNWIFYGFCSFEPCLMRETEFWENLEHLRVSEAYILVLVF